MKAAQYPRPIPYYDSNLLYADIQQQTSLQVRIRCGFDIQEATTLASVPIAIQNHTQNDTLISSIYAVMQLNAARLLGMHLAFRHGMPGNEEHDWPRCKPCLQGRTKGLDL